MADVFTTSKFEVKHDATMGTFSVVVKLPEPNGPLVFGVAKEHLQELLVQLTAALGEPESAGLVGPNTKAVKSHRDTQRQRALDDPSQGL